MSVDDIKSRLDHVLEFTHPGMSLPSPQDVISFVKALRTAVEALDDQKLHVAAFGTRNKAMDKALASIRNTLVIKEKPDGQA